MRTFLVLLAIIAFAASVVVAEEVSRNGSSLVKPVIDATAALNPATPQSFRPVEPKLVPLHVKPENTPTTGAANSSLLVPRIYDPHRHGPHRDPTLPTFGKPPQNFTKAAISKNPFGSTVTYRRAHDRNGCPCKRQVPEKFRYDVQYRKHHPRKYSPKCCCKKKKSKDGLPPIVAELKPKKHKKKALPPCPKPKAAPKKKISPEYYPAHNKKLLKAQAAAAAALKACLNGTVVKKKKGTIEPAFYPAQPLKRHRRKKGHKEANHVVIQPAGTLPK